MLALHFYGTLAVPLTQDVMRDLVMSRTEIPSNNEEPTYVPGGSSNLLHPSPETAPSLAATTAPGSKLAQDAMGDLIASRTDISSDTNQPTYVPAPSSGSSILSSVHAATFNASAAPNFALSHDPGAQVACADWCRLYSPAGWDQVCRLGRCHGCSDCETAEASSGEPTSAGSGEDEGSGWSTHVAPPKLSDLVLQLYKLKHPEAAEDARPAAAAPDLTYVTSLARATVSAQP